MREHDPTIHIGETLRFPSAMHLDEAEVELGNAEGRAAFEGRAVITRRRHEIAVKEGAIAGEHEAGTRIASHADGFG